MSLEELYNQTNFRNKLNTKFNGGAYGTPASPVDQATDGSVAVDFLDNTYQSEVRNRTPGDKTVVQAVGDDTTNGTFTTRAFTHYTSLTANTALTRQATLHMYNARNNEKKYESSIAGTPGALYNTNS